MWFFTTCSMHECGESGMPHNCYSLLHEGIVIYDLETLSGIESQNARCGNELASSELPSITTDR